MAATGLRVDLDVTNLFLSVKLMVLAIQHQCSSFMLVACPLPNHLISSSIMGSKPL
jgi:hypothetical protein